MLAGAMFLLHSTHKALLFAQNSIGWRECEGYIPICGCSSS